MAVTDTDTNNEICTAALRKIGVVEIDVAAESDYLEVARSALQRMLKAWQAKKMDLWLVTSMSIPATTSATYTLDPVRPLEIHSVRFKRNGIELPMQEMTREEYDNLPVKTTTGTPTQYYYDRQKEAAVLHVWPVPESVTTETLEITHTREIEDVALADVADVPAEWYDAVVYGLADRLMDDFTIDRPKITMRAAEELRDALAFDREGSVYFAGPYSE